MSSHNANTHNTVSLFINLQPHPDSRYLWVSWVDWETGLCSCGTHLTLTDFVGTHKVRMTMEEARAVQAQEDAFMANNPVLAAMLFREALKLSFYAMVDEFGRRPTATGQRPKG